MASMLPFILPVVASIVDIRIGLLGRKIKNAVYRLDLAQRVMG